MTFGWPFLLWALLLVPVAFLLYVGFQRRKASYAHRFAAPAMLPNVIPSRPGWKRHLPLLLYLLAVIALVVGLARPYALLAVPRQRATVMLVMDSSRSMSATDIEPDRLSVARSAARDFMDQVPKGFEVGVVRFYRIAEILMRPSTDHVAVRKALGRLEPSAGTAVAEAMATSLEAAVPPQAAKEKRRFPVVFVLLSDGNDTMGGDPLAVARDLKEARVRVYSIAFGDDGIEADGSKRFRPPAVDELKAVADITGGNFYDAPSAQRLRDIYSDIGTILATKREPQEITAAFVGAGFLFMVLGAGLSSLWFRRVA